MIFTTQGYGMGNNVFFPKKAAPPFPPWPADGFAEAKTDERGRFIVPMIAHGDLLVEVRLDEDLPLRPIIPDHLTVSAGLTTNLEFHMVPTVPVRGSIRAKDTGKPIAGAAYPYLLRRPPPGSRCGKRCTGGFEPGVAGPRRVAGNLHAGEVRSPGQWTDPALCKCPRAPRCSTCRRLKSRRRRRRGDKPGARDPPYNYREPQIAMPLDREEYVEQAYFFRTLRERMQQAVSTQDLLASLRQEVLSTTSLPYAIDFMAAELRLTGGFATAMAHLTHYFTPFQAYVIGEGERAEGSSTSASGWKSSSAKPNIAPRAPRRRESSSINLKPSAAIDSATIAAWTPSPATTSTRRLARVDSHRPPPGRADRLLRHDLRPQRTLSQEPRRSGKAGPLRRKGRADRPGQSAKGPALFVRRLGASPWLSGRAAAAAGGRGSPPAPHLAAKSGPHGVAAEALGGRAARRRQFGAILRRPAKKDEPPADKGP